MVVSAAITVSLPIPKKSLVFGVIIELGIMMSIKRVNSQHCYRKTQIRRLSWLAVVALCLPQFALAQTAIPNHMSRIDGGEYRPLYLSIDSPRYSVDPFFIDQYLVTNADFLTFVERVPEWKPSQVPALFAEPQYLQDWQGDQPTPNTESFPVTSVSWFAADAYCRAQGKRLPSISEWELAAMASETAADGSVEEGYRQTILEWYSQPQTSLGAVGRYPANYWGVYDMHGLVWEWTEDFNSTLVSGESRADSAIDNKLFCAAGASGSIDPSDYAAFMRYGFRSSLSAKFTLANLGFRCAQSMPPE